MKLLRLSLLIGALALLSVAARAQIIFPYPGHWVSVYLNVLSDPGFENGLSPWDNSQSYFYVGGDYTQEGFGSVGNFGHTGSHGYDLNVGEGSYNCLFVSVLQQKLSSPVPANIITDASIWAIAGGQTLYVSISYTDGTASTGSFYFDAASAPHGSGGWQQWNFKSLINTSKTISGIEFNADSGEGDDIVIDDVSLVGHYWFWI